MDEVEAAEIVMRGEPEIWMTCPGCKGYGNACCGDEGRVQNVVEYGKYVEAKKVLGLPAPRWAVRRSLVAPGLYRGFLELNPEWGGKPRPTTQNPSIQNPPVRKMSCSQPNLKRDGCRG